MANAPGHVCISMYEGKSTCMASDAKWPMYAPFKSMAIRHCVRSGMQKKRSTVGLP